MPIHILGEDLVKTVLYSFRAKKAGHSDAFFKTRQVLSEEKTWWASSYADFRETLDAFNPGGAGAHASLVKFNMQFTIIGGFKRSISPKETADEKAKRVAENPTYQSTIEGEIKRLQELIQRCENRLVHMRQRRSDRLQPQITELENEKAEYERRLAAERENLKSRLRPNIHNSQVVSEAEWSNCLRTGASVDLFIRRLFELQGERDRLAQVAKEQAESGFGVFPKRAEATPELEAPQFFGGHRMVAFRANHLKLPTLPSLSAEKRPDFSKTADFGARVGFVKRRDDRRILKHLVLDDDKRTKIWTNGLI